MKRGNVDRRQETGKTRERKEKLWKGGEEKGREKVQRRKIEKKNKEK